MNHDLGSFDWNEEAPPPPSCLGGVLFALGVTLITVVWAFLIWVLATEVLAWS